MKELIEKHLQAIDDKIEAGELPGSVLGRSDAAKECAKISIQFAIDVLKQAAGYGQSVFSDEINLDIMELQKQLSEL